VNGHVFIVRIKVNKTGSRIHNVMVWD
jgi:hypothetical protein